MAGCPLYPTPVRPRRTVQQGDGLLNWAIMLCCVLATKKVKHFRLRTRRVADQQLAWGAFARSTAHQLNTDLCGRTEAYLQ